MKQRQRIAKGKAPKPAVVPTKYKPKKQRKPLPKQKKRTAYYSKKRQRANRQYAKASKPKWEGQICQIRSPVCTTWAQGYNHPGGKENLEKLLNVENGQVCCNPCNTYCEDHHQWAVDNGFREKRNTRTKRYDNTYKPQ